MVLVVVLLPVGDDCAGFINMVEGIHVQAFIAHTVVEGFNVAVAPGLPGWNVMNTELADSEFVKGVGNELRSVITAQHQGRPALSNDFLHVVNNFLTRNGAVGNVKE